MYLGSWDIDDYLTIPVNTHTPSTGAATDADAVPTYRVYEDDTGTAIENGSLAKLDDTNTTGFYVLRIQLDAATGYEAGKHYTVYVSATVGSVVGTLSHQFQINAAVALHADWINGGRLDLLIDAIKLVTDALPNAGALTTLITHLTDIKGTSWSAGNDDLHALRTRGDIAWITGGGGGVADILNIQPLIPASIDLANTVTVRLALGLINSVDDLPTVAEITPGTISIDRKAAGATSWSAVVTDAACSEADGGVYYDEVFDSGSGYAVGDSIRVTFKNQLVTASANDFVITGSGGWIFQTAIREDMRGTDSGVPLSNFNTEMTNIKGAGFVALDNSLEAITDAIAAEAILLGLAMGAGFVTGTDSLEAIRNRGDLAWITGEAAGAGSVAYEYTLTSTVGGTPITDADVWATTDIGGTATVADGKTDAFGKVTFFLDPGTYYFWRQKTGFNFTNPDTEVVT